MKKMILFLLSLLVPVLLAPLWLGVFPLDIDEVEISDLQVDVTLPEVNAYDFLIQLEEGKELELLDQAAEADAYLEPALLDEVSWMTALPTMTGYMDAIDVSIAEASKRWEEGDFTGAEKEIERSLVVTQMIQDAPGVLIQELIAMTAKDSLLNSVRSLDLELNLEPFADNTSGLVQAYKMEFLVAENIIKETALSGKEQWYQSDYHLQVNRTIAELAEITRSNIAAIETLDSSAEDWAPEDKHELSYYGFNSLGRLLIETLTPKISGMLGRIQTLDSLIN